MARPFSPAMFAGANRMMIRLVLFSKKGLECIIDFSERSSALNMLSERSSALNKPSERSSALNMLSERSSALNKPGERSSALNIFSERSSA